MTIALPLSAVREPRHMPQDPLSAQALRPVQIWVPDVLCADFQEQAHRQSQAVAASTHAREEQTFVDDISVFAVDGPDE